MMLFFKKKNRFDKFYTTIQNRFSIILIVAIVILGCSTGSSPPATSGQWQQAELKTISVNSLSYFNDTIYAATNIGLYSQEKNKAEWTSLGLKEKDVLDIAFMLNNKLLAAVRISDFSSAIPSLYLSTGDDQSWNPYMNNYGGEAGEYTWITALATFSIPSDTLFAGGGVLYARSFNAGKSWQLLGERWDAWGGKLNFLRTDFRHYGKIWVGGHDPFGLPVLSQVTNNGYSWETIDIAEIPQDILISPEDTKKILIATDENILKTSDGGEKWQGVFKEAVITTFTHSARNPEVVYASGQNANGTLFFAASGDFGDSWEMIEWKTSPPGVQVNDVVSLMAGGHEVLYFGTNKGVYSYTFEE